MATASLTVAIDFGTVLMLPQLSRWPAGLMGYVLPIFRERLSSDKRLNAL